MNCTCGNEIGMDREKLANKLHGIYYTIMMLPSEWEDLTIYYKHIFLSHADIIIANKSSILTCKRCEGK
jgi:hypothetical protein